MYEKTFYNFIIFFNNSLISILLYYIIHIPQYKILNIILKIYLLLKLNLIKLLLILDILIIFKYEFKR